MIDFHINIYKYVFLLSINGSGKNCPNLIKDEREAVHSHMYKYQIRIKIADNGSAVVLGGKDNLLEASSQLSDN